LPKVAYHGIAYSIFLKYLDCLEDFRKNSHVKIPSKSPCTNIQSLQKIRIPNKIRKGLFLELGPAPVFGPANWALAFGQHALPLARSTSPHWPSLLARPVCPLGPYGLESVVPCPLAASFTGKRLTSRCLRPPLRPAEMRAPLDHLPHQADRCCHCLACARSASRRCFRSRNGRSTASSLPTTTPADPLPKWPPSSPLWHTTITAYSCLMPGGIFPPLTLLKGAPASAPPTAPPPPLLPLSLHCE
jgi:hypothetical protein